MSLFRFSQAASVAILPSALFGERYSLGARWVFSFQWCCYLIIDLISQRFGESWAPGLSRSHLDSAVELGSSYSILRHGAYPFTVLFFFISRSPFHCALSASVGLPECGILPASQFPVTPLSKARQIIVPAR